MESECVTFATSKSHSCFGVGIGEDYATELLLHMHNKNCVNGLICIMHSAVSNGLDLLNK